MSARRQPVAVLSQKGENTCNILINCCHCALSGKAWVSHRGGPVPGGSAQLVSSVTPVTGPAYTSRGTRAPGAWHYFRLPTTMAKIEQRVGFVGGGAMAQVRAGQGG